MFSIIIGAIRPNNNLSCLIKEYDIPFVIYNKEEMSNDIKQT